MNHRADIDGLRGVAVLAVVLFHGFPKYFPGGYIGVDILFLEIISSLMEQRIHRARSL